MFALLSYFLLQISLMDTKTSYQSSIQVWCHDFLLFMFDKAKEKEGWWSFNENWEQIYRALVRFTYLKTHPLGLWYVNRLNVFEWVLNTPWTLLSVRECLWVIMNSHWTPNECTWMPMSECEQHLNIHWVHMNAIEWVWTPIACAWMPLTYYWMRLTVVWPRGRMPLSEFWTHPECYRVHVNVFEWVLSIPWTLLSARECLWVSMNSPWTSIECTWMPVSKSLEGLNAHL